MKPLLIAVASAMISSPLLPPLAPPLRDPAPPAATAELGRLVWLAKADAAAALGRTEFAFPRGLPARRVVADPVALRGGLTMLLSLSARSMESRPRRRMDVRLSAAGGRVAVELRDAGPGLSVEELGAMYRSSGPGLSAARRRLERAGGVVSVTSQSGAGTVYRVEFPAAG